MPYSMLFMALALIPALAYGYQYVATGNEFSANFGNMRFKGEEINHQFSKSHEYESAFNQFLTEEITTSVKYFSALRPFSDLRIAAMLSRLQRYFGHFVSCNKGGDWCKNCPKCAFTFLALAAFLSSDQLITIFGENLLLRATIRRHILDLVDGEVKPWECVGTQEECRLALRLALEKHADDSLVQCLDQRDWGGARNGAPSLDASQRQFFEQVHEPHNIPQALVGSITGKAAVLTPRVSGRI